MHPSTHRDNTRISSVLQVMQHQWKYPESDCDDFVSFVHNNSLHLLQCYFMLPKEQKMHTFVNQKLGWRTTVLTTFKQKNGIYFPKPGLARVMFDNHLYCFGGKDAKGKLDYHLVALDIEKKQWRGELQANSNGENYPQARVYASLSIHQNNYLILYGGSVASLQQNANSYIWSFSIDSGQWYRLPNQVIPYVFIQSFCVTNNQIYLFGRNQNPQQNQLYSYKISSAPYKDKYQIQIQNAEETNSQSQKQAHPILGSNICIITSNSNRVLFVFQSVYKNAHEKIPALRMWIYDCLTCSWLQTEMQINTQFKQIVYSQSSNTFFFISDKKKVNSVYLFSISNISLSSFIKQDRFKSWKSCEICYQTLINNNTLMEPAFKIPQQLLDSLSEKLTFPFAALGIFADLAITHTATYINYNYTYYKGAPILRIEDDSRVNYINEELQQIIVNFSAQTNCNFSSIQKRSRGVLIKDFAKRQYGTNIKIASMRLGSEMLYVSLTPNYEARVAYFCIEGDEYVCYFYVFDEKTNKLYDDYSTEAKAYVQRKYGDLILASLHENPGSIKYAPYKNTTFILKLKTVINEQGKQIPQIQPYLNHQTKDIMYISPNPSIYKAYLQHGARIHESIDVSLAAYLSAFFIKNEHMRITIQVRDSEKRTIRKQDVLQHLDKNALIKVITSIDASIANYDLKSIDLMLNNRLYKKTGVFHNGILIYHKNRLIKRFGCELGNLLNCLQSSDKLSYGYFNIFGSIEVPDSLEVNQQKTDFVNQLMLQKLFSRLKMIHQLMAKNLDSQKQDAKSAPNKEGPKLRSRVIEQHEARQTPIKKVKRTSQEDESYHGN